jgi:tRNA-dihydrouridine synthase B
MIAPDPARSPSAPTPGAAPEASGAQVHPLAARAAKVTREYAVDGKRIFPNAYLAPMSGVTDLSFRRLISRIAGGRTGLLVSEFVTVEGLTRLNPRICRQMAFAPEERPFTVQIYGAEPDRMGWGAAMVEEAGADFVEINCGCPAPKIVRKGGGSGLLRDLGNLRDILASVKRSVKIPVTVKVRVGWSDDSVNLLETQKVVEGEGAGALVIHGRTRTQGYKGLANWDLIALAKSQGRIPVIGNGDVLKVEDVIDKLERYGVDGVAVGRGAMHNPWIFAQMADLYEGTAPQEPTLDEQERIFHWYLELLREETDIEGRLLGKLKQMAARVLRCLPGGFLGRTAVLRSQSLPEYLDNLHAFFEKLRADGYRGRDLDNVRELNGGRNEDVVFGKDYKG